MDEEVVQQIVDELFSSLEPLDTQSAALMEFLKAKGIASDEELAPYLKQAGNTSSVRWLAAKVRIKSLISSAMKDVGKEPSEVKAGESESHDSAEEKKASDSESSDDRSQKNARTADSKDDSAAKSTDEQTRKETDSDDKREVEQPEISKDAKGRQRVGQAPAAETNEDKNQVAPSDNEVKGKVA